MVALAGENAAGKGVTAPRQAVLARRVVGHQALAQDRRELAFGIESGKRIGVGIDKHQLPSPRPAPLRPLGRQFRSSQ